MAPRVDGQSPAAVAVAVSLADLHALVYPTAIPPGSLDELPALYGSLASTEPFFRIHEGILPTGSCILEGPHHVLVFCQNGDTVEILNKVFEIPPADAARACTAIFRAMPHIRRIHLEVMFPPNQLPLPWRALSDSLHRLIDLPATVDEYTASLGVSARRNLRKYERRLLRDFPDRTTQVMVTGDRSSELFQLFRDWKASRFAKHGKRSYWENKPEAVKAFTDLLRESGEAQVTYVGGEPAGMILFFSLGSVIDSNEGAFDPRYERYALGSLMNYWMVCHAVRSGARRVYLGMGPNDYLEQFGSKTVSATRLSVFRNPIARLWSLDEASDIARRRLRRAVHTSYWRIRHVAVRVARAAGVRRRIDEAG